jgi:carboxypeptidase C (cathepsin A)
MGDADAFYRFIQIYLSRYQRWRSPLFSFGESYGTTRAAALVNHLADNYIPVNGVVLLSVGLDFTTLMPGNMNDLPHQVIVPSYTMIAAYQKKLAPELTANLDATIKKVEQWCATDYAQALALGNAPPEKRKQIIEQLVAYAGLKPELIEENDLRIEPHVFMHNLLKDRKTRVRACGRPLCLAHAAEQRAGAIFRSRLEAMFAAFNAAMNDYAGSELGYKFEPPYVIWNFEGINRAWDCGPGMSGYPQMATNL